jgi:hypothetical protein
MPSGKVQTVRFLASYWVQGYLFSCKSRKLSWVVFCRGYKSRIHHYSRLITLYTEVTLPWWMGHCTILNKCHSHFLEKNYEFASTKAMKITDSFFSIYFCPKCILCIPWVANYMLLDFLGIIYFFDLFSRYNFLYAAITTSSNDYWPNKQSVMAVGSGTEGVSYYSDIANHRVMKHTACKDYELG